MEPGIFVPLIVFSFILAMIWTFLSHSRWKAQQKLQQSESGSLRTSELKALMREAVEEANAPLIARIETLEHRFEESQRPRLLPASEEYIDPADVPDTARPVAARRSTS